MGKQDKAEIKEIYEPAEDSYLALECIKNEIKKAKYNAKNLLALDMGTGTGILAKEMSKKLKVIAADINKKAGQFIEKANKTAKKEKRNKIIFVKSSLFSRVKQKFDLIVFNAPYLPYSKRNSKTEKYDHSLHGGKNGYETIEKFISNLNSHLQDNGKALLVFSSLTNKSHIDLVLDKNLFEHRTLRKKHIFFEDIYVYEIKKTPLLRKISKKAEQYSIKNLRYYASGHRGVIFKGTKGRQSIAIKAKNPRSEATGNIKNEALWLKRLNKYNIGPKLVFYDNMFFCYSFVYGKTIGEFIREAEKKDIIIMLKRLIKKLNTLDRLKINKEEMHRPVKHIIISKNSPKMIDFERCHYTEKPKNITQFFQFLNSKKIKQMLDKKGIKIRITKKELREYKKDYEIKRVMEKIK